MMKPSQLDPDQIAKYGFDEALQAHRMVLVAGQSPTVNMVQTEPSVSRFQTIEVPVIIKETEIKEIKVPQIILQPEVKVVEIIKEVPVIVKETIIKEIEVPKIIIQKEYINNGSPVAGVPMFTKVVTIIQALALIGLALK